MPHKIVPSKIVYTSKDGGQIKLEIDHKIDLEITINIEGGVASVKGVKESKKVVEDKVAFEIPDFSSKAINFGKEV